MDTQNYRLFNSSLTADIMKYGKPVSNGILSKQAPEEGQKKRPPCLATSFLNYEKTTSMKEYKCMRCPGCRTNSDSLNRLIRPILQIVGRPAVYPRFRGQL